RRMAAAAAPAFQMNSRRLSRWLPIGVLPLFSCGRTPFCLSSVFGRNYRELDMRGVSTIVIDSLLCNDDFRVDSKLASIVQVSVVVREITTRYFNTDLVFLLEHHASNPDFDGKRIDFSGVQQLWVFVLAGCRQSCAYGTRLSEPRSDDAIEHIDRRSPW